MKISSPKFLLKEPKLNNDTLISLVVRFNDQRLVYSTGEKINPLKWNFKDQRVINSKKYPEAVEINAYLNKMDSLVSEIFRRLKNDGILPTPEIAKKELSRLLNDKPEPAKITLFSFIENYISVNAPIKKIGTTKVYRVSYNHLINYSKAKKITLDFNDIDLNFYSNYINYLVNDLGFGQNTISKYIKTLKVFLNAATDANVNKNVAFKSKKFKGTTEEVVKIYLTDDEINLLANLDLSSNPKLDRVRDFFIVGCLTGLRFSDLTSLKSENIFDETIKIRTKKTGELVTIPISPKVKSIYLKYDGNFPPPISNQKMNEYLKELGEMAGIENEVIVSRQIRGVIERKCFKKFELITCHCSRRSFATNAYLAGIPSISIMKITGHKTEQVFMGYIRVTQEENAQLLKRHDFFN